MCKKGHPRKSVGGSKWAIIGMTKVAAKEYGRDGIRVNAVSPGIAETEMLWYTLDSYRNDFGATNLKHRSLSGNAVDSDRFAVVRECWLNACKIRSLRGPFYY